MSQYIEWSALAQVVVAGLLVGAGLPTLFALGLKFLSPPASAEGQAVVEMAPAAEGAAAATVAFRPAGVRLVGAVACFAAVLVAVVAGIAFLVAGGH